LRDLQRTIQKPVEHSGIGLFSGEQVRIALRPAEPSTGVCFVRTDLPEKPRVPASPDAIANKYRRTILRKDGVEIESVEHLLAALAGLGIDNLEVEISNREPPIGDGSARVFVELLKRAGIVEQDEERRGFVVQEPMSVFEGDASLVVLPSDRGFTVSYNLDFDSDLIKPQSLHLEVTEKTFEEEIAPARTFGLHAWIDEFRSLGLGKGASNENCLVIREDGSVTGPLDHTPVPLRFPDEFVRHKILDLLGDLFLANVRLQARVVGTKSGHLLNARMVERIVDAVAEEEMDRTARADSRLDIVEIQKILPHRYPFLLVDRVVEIKEGQYAVGVKNVTFNEPFFQGHWPGRPVMPGVLQLEAMAQVAGILLLRKIENVGKLPLMLSIDKVKFRSPVVPGDQLRLEARALKVKPRTAHVEGRALVHGKIVAEAEFKFMLADADAD